jgi:uncharacterized protein (DUF2147 family)
MLEASMSGPKLLLAIAALFLGFGPFSAETAHDPTGIWLTQAGDAKIRINHCISGLCGTIVWLKVPVDPKTGRPQIDDKNVNPSLAKRPVIGINIFSKMKSVAHDKWSGTIYSADDGKSYSSEVVVAGPRKLEVRGCVLRILCGGETWTKVGEVTVAETQPTESASPAHENPAPAESRANLTVANEQPQH